MASRKARSAFDTLMEGGAEAWSAKKRRQKHQDPVSKERVKQVQCPLCGTSIPEVNINFHLDKCIVRQEKEKQQESEDNACSEHDVSERAATVGHNLGRQQTHAPVDAHQRGQQQPKVSQSDDDELETGVGSNAFSHLMEESRKVFSSLGRRREWLHVTDDSKVVSFRPVTGERQQNQQPKSMIWSAMVLTEKKKVELTVSTSIVPAPKDEPQKQWVRHHSRLPVPVLKSMLQKSIRRRKPLPSVRVAMELADKARGELLRRLPIIVLEDSTLHPELPLLVWLMVADSRGYNIPVTLMRRVFSVIFQVASCPWTDYVPRDFEPRDNLPTVPTETFDESTPGSENEQLLLQALRIRAQYGGMACDMNMLSRYVGWWHHRFRDLRVVEDSARRRLGLEEKNASASIIRWNQIPCLLHSRAAVHANTPLHKLLDSGVVFLQYKDVCIEGVDFHCSQVLDKALEDTSLVSGALDWLQRHNHQVPDTSINQAQLRKRLLHIFKGCMWSFSSGINHRRPLLEPNGVTPANNGQDFGDLWSTLVSPKARSFMASYVHQRLHTNARTDETDTIANIT